MPEPRVHPDLQDQLQQAVAGRYRVDGEIGAGGMAVVFRAYDLRHAREVAIKVLRPEFAPTIGPARFLQEVRITAGLTHPHILTLIDSGEAGGLLYYVMPYLDGESLRTRVGRGPLSVTDTARYLRDIVDALAAAHANDLVHRDIKPENIMLVGRHAVVMDFGIAKAIHAAASAPSLTTADVSIGTPAYMAPEQVAADPNIDHRADLYATGVVAYEMLVGHHPFHGLTPQLVMAAHVTQTPPLLDTVRPDVPAWLAALVMRCLEKDPAVRWQRADDMLAELEPQLGSGVHSDPRVVAAPRLTWKTAMTVMGVIAISAVAVTLWRTRTEGPEYAMGRATVVTGDPGLELYPRLSPDGRSVVYAAGTSLNMRIFVRPAAGGRALRLTSDSVDVEAMPRWSPDGTEILYGTGDELRVVPALGGTSRIVVKTPAQRDLFSAAWSPDGKEIAWTQADTLFASAASGGVSRKVAVSRELHSCDWSPSGRWIACTSGDLQYDLPGPLFGNLAASRIVVVPAVGGPTVPVTDSTTVNQGASWGASDAELFFISDSDGPRDVYAQRLDGNGRRRGAPRRLTVGLNAHTMHIARDGARMTYSVFESRSNLWTVDIPVATAVSVRAAQSVTTGNQWIESMMLSRDGTWLVYDSDLSGNSDIYRVRASGGSPERLTTSVDAEYAPDLSPDGRFLAYHTFRAGSRDIIVLPLEGGDAAQITHTSGQEGRPRWSPSGDAIAFVDLEVRSQPYVMPRSRGGVWGAPVARDTSATILRNCIPSPDWSADGQFLAYCAGGAIRIVPPERGEARTLYAPDTSAGRPFVNWVMWARDGGSLFFRGLARNGEEGIWRVDRSGGAPRPVVRFDDPSRPVARAEFAVSATRLYFTISDRRSDVSIAELIKK